MNTNNNFRADLWPTPMATFDDASYADGFAHGWNALLGYMHQFPPVLSTATGAAPEMSHALHPPLIDWLIERRENCLRLADLKRGEVRDGWLDDAAYFDAAIEAARRA